MKGNNELHLNEATIIEAIQQWLDAKMPDGAPKIVGVTDKGSLFVVQVTDREKMK